MNRVTNEDVLKRERVKEELLRTIERRQLKFLGHSIRKAALEELSLSGKFPGKRASGEQRKQFLKNFELGSVRDIWNSARKRQEWQNMVVRLSPENRR